MKLIFKIIIYFSGNVHRHRRSNSSQRSSSRQTDREVVASQEKSQNVQTEMFQTREDYRKEGRTYQRGVRDGQAREIRPLRADERPSGGQRHLPLRTQKRNCAGDTIDSDYQIDRCTVTTLVGIMLSVFSNN